MKKCLSKTTDARSGQSLSEYTLLIMVVTIAAVVIFPMVKRGTQSLIRTGADQIGSQAKAEQDFVDGSYMVYSKANTQMDTKMTKKYDLNKVSYTSDDITSSQTSTLTNMGFTQRDD